MMSDCLKIWRLFLPHAGCAKEPLPLSLERHDTGFRFVGPIFTSLYLAAKYGRIWYLPKCGLYAFRVECEPFIQENQMMWLIVDDLYSAAQGKVALASESFVEESEPCRARLTSSEYFEYLGYRQIQEFRKDPEHVAQNMKVVEEHVRVYEKEPFSDVAASIDVKMTKPRAVKGEVVCYPKWMQINFFDGSYLVVDNKRVGRGFFSTEEEKNPQMGFLLNITEWSQQPHSRM